MKQTRLIAISLHVQTIHQAQGGVLCVAPTDDLFFRSSAYRGVCSRVDAKGNRDFATVFDVDGGRRPYSRQGSVNRGHAADNQSLSQQTADLQRRLEDLDLPADGLAHSLSGASCRFLATSRQLCGRQRKAAGGNCVAAFLGHPDHSVRIDCHVLHDARTGARDWAGKSVTDILRPSAFPANLSEALMAEANGVKR